MMLFFISVTIQKSGILYIQYTNTIILMQSKSHNFLQKNTQFLVLLINYSTTLTLIVMVSIDSLSKKTYSLPKKLSKSVEQAPRTTTFLQRTSILVYSYCNPYYSPYYSSNSAPHEAFKGGKGEDRCGRSPRLLHRFG